jgi:hypothetical protein
LEAFSERFSAGLFNHLYCFFERCRHFHE